MALSVFLDFMGDAFFGWRNSSKVASCVLRKKSKKVWWVAHL